MKDRVPQYPGRVKMTMPDGSTQYVTLERADEPIEAGTPLNKATLLSDATAQQLNLSESDPTLDDALRRIIMSYNYVTDQSGKVFRLITTDNPVPLAQTFPFFNARDANYTYICESKDYFVIGASDLATLSIGYVVIDKITSEVHGFIPAKVTSSSGFSSSGYIGGIDTTDNKAIISAFVQQKSSNNNFRVVSVEVDLEQLTISEPIEENVNVMTVNAFMICSAKVSNGKYVIAFQTATNSSNGSSTY